MAKEPSWDDIFRAPDDGDRADAETHAPAPVAGPAAAAAQAPAPQKHLPSRRELRRGSAEKAYAPRKKKRRWGGLVALLVFLLVATGTGVVGWNMYGDRIQQVLGIGEPNDYDGSGNGEAVTVVIQAGDIGSTVAKTLEQAEVTRTFTAFYKLLLADETISFEPGNYTLQKHMSAKSALAALQDPANKVLNKITIREGISAPKALATLAAGTALPLADFEAAAADYVALGVPAEAPSIEGFLFPATYTFDPGVTARDVLQRLVTETITRLDAAGVAPADRFRTVTLASIVQRESGPSVEDMHKIARVFENRLAVPMKLQSDATVAYGTGNTDRVTTTKAERADASNLYNTYANEGLPVGPIGLPGDDAIDSVLHPADGPWLFFVAVNLKTGETVFSTTADEHAAAVEQWKAWCRESDENKAYCA